VTLYAAFLCFEEWQDIWNNKLHATYPTMCSARRNKPSLAMMLTSTWPLSANLMKLMILSKKLIFAINAGGCYLQFCRN